MLDGKYSFEYGLIFRWIRKGISKHHQVENEAFGFPWKSYFFFFLEAFLDYIWIFSRKSFSQDGDQFRKDPIQVLLRKRVSFFSPLRPILDKNRDPSNRFYYFFFNHISFLLSQARFSQLNAAWLIRPFLHSSCPTKRSFQPFSLSVIYKYHFHSDSRSKRKKKKKKKK